MQNFISQLDEKSLQYRAYSRKNISTCFADLVLPIGKQMTALEMLHVFIDADTYYKTQELISTMYQQEINHIRNHKVHLAEDKYSTKYLDSFQEKMSDCALFDRDLVIMVYLGIILLLSQEIFAHDLEIKQQRSFSPQARNRMKLSLSIRLTKALERVTRYSLPFKIEQFHYDSYIDLLTPFFLAERDPTNYLTVLRDYLEIEKPSWNWKRYTHICEGILKSAERQSGIGGIALSKENLAYQEINKTISKTFGELSPDTVHALLPKILANYDCMAELLGPPSAKLKKPSQKILYLSSDFQSEDSEELVKKVLIELKFFCQKYPLPAFHDQAMRGELLDRISKRFHILTNLDGMQTVESYSHKALVYMVIPPFLYDNSLPDKDRFFTQGKREQEQPTAMSEKSTRDSDELAGMDDEVVEVSMDEMEIESPSTGLESADGDGEDLLSIGPEDDSELAIIEESGGLNGKEGLDSESGPNSDLLTEKYSAERERDVVLSVEDAEDEASSDETIILIDSLDDDEEDMGVPVDTREKISRLPMQTASRPSPSLPENGTVRDSAQQVPQKKAKSLPMLLLEGKIDVVEYFIRTTQQDSEQKSAPPARIPNLILQEGEMYAREADGQIVIADPTTGTIRFITKKNETSIQIKENEEWVDVYSRIKVSTTPFSGKIASAYDLLEETPSSGEPELKDYLFQLVLVTGQIHVFFD